MLFEPGGTAVMIQDFKGDLESAKAIAIFCQCSANPLLNREPGCPGTCSIGTKIEHQFIGRITVSARDKGNQQHKPDNNYRVEQRFSIASQNSL